MVLDIRLDFITKIAPDAIEKMTDIRQAYIKLDELLTLLAQEASVKQLPAAQRTISLARTFNEQSCQSAIKTLCLLGEMK